jgi:hypothetical protein
MICRLRILNRRIEFNENWELGSEMLEKAKLPEILVYY